MVILVSPACPTSVKLILMSHESSLLILGEVVCCMNVPDGLVFLCEFTLMSGITNSKKVM